MSGRNRWVLWLAALLAALLLGGGALAMEPDPRSFAMGGAYTAVVNDATAVFWNPAALGEVKWAGAQFGLGGWADDLEQVNKLNATYEQGGTAPPEFKVSGGFGAGLNLALLNHVGLGINGSLDLQAQNRLAETVYGTTPLVTLGSQLRGEGAVGLAFQVAKPPLNLGALAVGGVVKYMAIGKGGVNQEIKTDSNNAITEYKTTSTASQATGFGLDLGVQAKLTDLLVVGLKVQDLVSQASGTTKTTTETVDASGNRTTTELSQDWRPDLSPKLRAGVAFRPPTGTTLAADLEQDGTLHLGAEQNLLWNALSLRTGAILAPNKLTEYRAGLGFNLWALHLDVAAGVVGKGASAMLGLSAKF